eukprot:4109123-Pleurochrysis_carterae.AAC.1
MKLSNSSKDKDVLERQRDEFSGQEACNCNMCYSALNQEQVVAMPCNLVRMLQGRDVPSFSRVQVQEEELCQPVVLFTVQPLKGSARSESIVKTDSLRPRTPEPGVL